MTNTREEVAVSKAILQHLPPRKLSADEFNEEIRRREAIIVRAILVRKLAIVIMGVLFFAIIFSSVTITEVKP